MEDRAPIDQVGSVLASQLQASGIEMAIDSMDAATYEALVTSGQNQIFVIGWLGVARTPAEHLSTLFRSDSLDNVSRYGSDVVDALIAAAERETDPAAREAMWQAVETQVIADVGIVPLVQFRTTGVLRPGLSGFAVRADGTVDLSTVAFSPPDE